MVKRLMLTVLIATGGTGAYIYSSGLVSPKKDGADSAATETATAAGEEEPASADEWHVEYVDGEGNPIERGSSFPAATRIKATSNSLLQRIPGLSTSKRNASGSSGSTESLKRSSGG